MVRTAAEVHYSQYFVKREDAILESTPEEDYTYPPESTEVYGQKDAPGDATKIPLFEARHARNLGNESTGPVKDDGSPVEDDIVAFCGGTVWCMDWCPARCPPQANRGTLALASTSLALASTSAPADDDEAELELLAVGVHPKPAATHSIGAAQSGPGLIQLWQVPSALASGGQGKARLPSLAACIKHHGGVVWALSWCPSKRLQSPSPSADALPRLGLLAAAYGDGSLEVFAVPPPDALPRPCSTQLVVAQGEDQQGTVDAGGAAPPPVVRLRPALHLPCGALGEGSHPSCVAWLPSAPHDTLLVGCWDGRAAILRLPEDPEASGWAPLVIVTHKASLVALRRVQWLPSEVVDGMNTGAHRRVFATFGHSGDFAVWDTASIMRPLYSKTNFGVGSYVLDGLWFGDPSMIVCAMEMGVVRKVVMNADTPASESLLAVPEQGAIWCVEAQRQHDLLLVGCESGCVSACYPYFNTSTRQHVACMPLGGIRVEHGKAQLLNTAGCGMRPYLSEMGVVEKVEKDDGAEHVLPHALQAVHCVRVTEDDAGRWWCAAGYACGFLRLFLMRPSPRVPKQKKRKHRTNEDDG